MGISVATTRVAVITTTGNQDITISGFGTPKAALLILSGATSDATAADHARLSIGVTDGTRQLATTLISRHAQGTSDAYQNAVNTQVIRSLDGTTGAVEASATFSAWITDGIRINWNDAAPAGYLLTVVLFGGSDLSVYAGSFASANTIDGTVDVTSPNFQPDLLITFNARGSAGISMGFVKGGASPVERSVYFYSRDARPTMETTSHVSDAYGLITGSGTALYTAINFGSFDSQGFTATSRVTAASTNVYYLALRFGGAANVNVYTFDTPTATGDNTDTGAGFQPQSVFYVPMLNSSVNADATNGTSGEFGFIGVTAAAQYCTTLNDQDAAADSNTQSLSDDQAANVPLYDGAAGLAATFSAFTSSGVTLNWSDVETSARKWIAVAIENPITLKSITDAGSGSESTPAITATAAVTDSATGTETDPPPISAALPPITDASNAGSDAVSVSNLVSISDNLSGSDDDPTIAAALALSETGSGSDDNPAISASLSLSETGSGTETDPPPISAILPAIADSASGSDDDPTIAAALSLSETGSGSDADPSNIAATLSVSDASTAGSDAVTVDTGGTSTPETTGSASLVQSGSTSSSASVTVPADAEVVLLLVSYWINGGGGLSSVSLGGNAMSLIREVSSYDTGANSGYITTYYLANPPTGSQTFAWTWDAALTEGASFYLVYLKTVDTSAPIRDHDYIQGTGGTLEIETRAFDSDPNDLVFVVGYSYTGVDGNAAPTGSGQTEILDSGDYNSCETVIGTKPGVSGTTTMKFSGSYPMAIGISVKPPATGDQSKTVTDTATGADADPTITVSAAITDTATGSDGTPPIAATLSVSDLSNAGSDSILGILAALSIADSGQGTDGTPSITVTIAVTDAATGSEIAPPIAVTLSLSDASSAASDVISVLTESLKSIVDSATGNDVVSNISVSFSLPDTATGSDALSISAILPAITDAGIGTDGTPSISAAIPISDSATGSETTPSAAVTFSLSDAATGDDIISVLAESLKSIVDSAVGTDAVSNISVSLVIPETAAGTETISEISAALSISDDLSGSDALSQIAAALAVSDFSDALDVVLAFDATIQIVSISMTILRRTATFAILARSADFSLATRTDDFSLSTRDAEFSIVARSTEFTLAE